MIDARAILDHPAIGESYFFPRRTPVADPFMVQTGDVMLRCHRRIIAPDAPVLLHFHGNGEVVADWVPDLPDALAAIGLSTVMAEYRGYGGSTGVPALAAMLEDALAVARQAQMDPARMLVYGRSVGSIYALHVAATLPVAGLVIESGIADVHQRLAMRVSPAQLGTDADGLRAAVSELFDHQAKIASVAGKLLVLHARGDDLVPPAHAEALAQWAAERGRLRLFDRGDHNTIHAYNGAEIIAEVARFSGECGLELSSGNP